MLKPNPKDPHSKRAQVLLLLGWQCQALVNGIARYAGEARWALDISYIRVGRMPLKWKGNGIVSLITHPNDYEAIRPFLHLPIVDLSMSWVLHLPPNMRKAGLKVPRVAYDNHAIGRVAAEHLLERGFKDLAFFNCYNFWFETERMADFRRTVEAAGARFHEITYHLRFSPDMAKRGRSTSQAERWLTEKIRSLPKPLGIFVPADDLSPHVFSACAEAGVLVPEEVAVLGCDNDPLFCDFSVIPLSSVVVDWETMGYEAARLLDAIMHGRKPPSEPILVPPTGVATRMSTNVMAVPHPKVARALSYIWEHFREPIHINDVARAVGITRRGLEQAFAKHLDRTVAMEIAHCRVEYAKRLLLETEMKIHVIAEQSGFSGIYHFSDAFLRVTGLRPSRFRKQNAVGSKGGADVARHGGIVR